MLESLGWVVAVASVILVAVARCVSSKRSTTTGASRPPTPVMVEEVRGAIADSANEEIDHISEAIESGDPAGKLAALANRAARRRK